MKVLILGATGMLGNGMLRFLVQDKELSIYATSRSSNVHSYFSEMPAKIVLGVDVENHDSLVKLFSEVKPDIVINCVGLVKQLDNSKDPLKALPINTLLPHRLSLLCKLSGSRLIHISTDCVFSGSKGNYLETDFADSDDLYGRSKLLGEVVDCTHAITLRTSIIGHELSGQRSLICWFLAQHGSVKGFKSAIFSGVPTVELARIIHEFVLPKPELCGLYHVAANPISKFDLLQIVAKTYSRDIDIIPSDELVINRSLNAKRFEQATGYVPPSWQELIQRMYEFK